MCSKRASRPAGEATTQVMFPRPPASETAAHSSSEHIGPIPANCIGAVQPTSSVNLVFIVPPVFPLCSLTHRIPSHQPAPPGHRIDAHPRPANIASRGGRSNVVPLWFLVRHMINSMPELPNPPPRSLAHSLSIFFARSALARQIWLRIFTGAISEWTTPSNIALRFAGKRGTDAIVARERHTRRVVDFAVMASVRSSVSTSVRVNAVRSLRCCTARSANRYRRVF